ncbi:ATP-binding cassette domain-containing protein [Bradyrhizobium sp. CSA207]|uniref:ABC transporter ATP-binding protein n=1 Tax=Bradyrhizobium sp. CSA207 TaxID=2698826 RepID=UPI0023B03570|nr:ABC transporter ATP-binding protein [Bradyrhizobium sp. CSA207]MDE5445782.1 ATP-binding cassette domain-containing protein [Bradyrhizobium sp. CSA207]
MTRIQVDAVSIHFGGVKALQDVSLEVRKGEVLALIGPNGAGKTTLFNVISAIYQPTSGRVRLEGQDVAGLAPFQLAHKGLTRTFQNLQIFFRMTALENVMVGRNIRERGNLFGYLFGLPSVRRQNADSRLCALELLKFVGLDRYADRPAGELSYGILKRLEIARALALEPTVLLLDEPVAGCNATETAEIDQVIRKVVSTGVSILLVEHDIHLVMNLADKVHVLDRGVTLATGTPQEVRRNPAVIEAYLGESQDEQEPANAES